MHPKVSLRQKLSGASIVKIRTSLNTMFEDAIENEIIIFNPVSKAKKLRQTENPKVQRIKLKPFNTKEIISILGVCDTQDKNMIATLFFTGLRAGELIGLKWDCIDFEKKTIFITRQIVQGIEKESLKTSKSRRIIPIIDALIPYLKEQYKITEN